MRKFLIAICIVSSILILPACSFGIDSSAPVIAVHSGSDIEDESKQFVELSKQSGTADEESDISYPVSYPTEESEVISEEPSVTVSEYEQDGFKIKGFDSKAVSGLINSLKEIIGSTDAHISIYYESLATGNRISYDADRVYRSGSVIKAPYAKFIIERGNDLDEELELQASQKQDGSGSLKNAAVGSKYTVRDLIKYAVCDSDNTAYRMLCDRFGYNGFNEYCASIGASTTLSSYDNLGYMSAYEAAAFFSDIYDFDKSGSSGYYLTDCLVRSTYRYLLPSGLGSLSVAHKFGYMSGSVKVLHDVGIVYSDNPYIIAVMTDFNPAGGNGRAQFRDIASAVNTFNDSYTS